MSYETPTRDLTAAQLRKRAARYIERAQIATMADVRGAYDRVGHWYMSMAAQREAQEQSLLRQ